MQKWIIAEIMEINADELSDEVDDKSDIEGHVKDDENLMWRRAVRKTDKSYRSYEGESEEDPCAAYNLVCIYRWATRNEIVHYNLEGNSLIVVSVMTTDELLLFIKLDEVEF